MDWMQVLERWGFPTVVALILLVKFDRRQGRIERHLERAAAYLQLLVHRTLGITPGDDTPLPMETKKIPKDKRKET